MLIRLTHWHVTNILEGCWCCCSEPRDHETFHTRVFCVVMTSAEREREREIEKERESEWTREIRPVIGGSKLGGDQRRNFSISLHSIHSWKRHSDDVDFGVCVWTAPRLIYSRVSHPSLPISDKRIDSCGCRSTHYLVVGFVKIYFCTLLPPQLLSLSLSLSVWALQSNPEFDQRARNTFFYTSDWRLLWNIAASIMSIIRMKVRRFAVLC